MARCISGRIICFTLFILILNGPSTAQDNSYVGGGGYVEFLDGSLPLVISVPHGGYEKPDTIPEREGNFSKNQDIYTIEIARGIYREIYKITGRHPYMVINHLHRTRLDANRSIEEAANGNPDAEKVWIKYQFLIDSIEGVIEKNYGKGLFIDLHGHRHEIKRIELGYLLSAEELQLDDELLNSGLLNEYTSISNLLETNKDALTISELIRGEESLGTLLCQRGQPCMPSKKYKSPGPGEPYFRGGYNTMRHGSFSGGTIDGIQIEVDLQTRSDLKKQKRVAGDVSCALIEFLRIHYFKDLLEWKDSGQP